MVGGLYTSPINRIIIINSQWLHIKEPSYHALYIISMRFILTT